MGGRNLCNFQLHSRSTVFLVLCYAMLLHHCCFFCEAAAFTDPKEVNALRIIASKMGYTQWNFNVDPCSQNPSWYTHDDRDGEQGVICNCVYNKNTTCHVLKLILLYKEMAGIIPPELANLTYLEEIDFRSNLLSGTIPSSIGSLTSMKYLTFRNNNLSGEIPKEFGKLTNLLSLSFDMNDLSGALPPELGNLANLEYLYSVFGDSHRIKLEKSLNPSPLEIRLGISHGGNPSLIHFETSSCVSNEYLSFNMYSW